MGCQKRVLMCEILISKYIEIDFSSSSCLMFVQLNSDRKGEIKLRMQYWCVGFTIHGAVIELIGGATDDWKLNVQLNH